MSESSVAWGGRVPEFVRNKALAAGATRWLDDLPSLVAGLSREWSIDVGAAYPDATEALVAEATLHDGTPAVLKLCVPRVAEAARYEITVLRLTGGQGCVRLLRADPERGALLLERLGRPLVRLTPLRRMGRRYCRRPPPGSGARRPTAACPPAPPRADG